MSSVSPYKDEQLEFERQFPCESSCDVMELIFSFLNDWRSRIRFGAVCKSWRWVAQRYSRLKLGRTFGLLLSDGYKGRHSFRFSDGGVTQTLHIPEEHGLCYSGSSQGWLMMQYFYHYQMKLILLNPLSKSRIRLPIKAKAKVKTGRHRILPMTRIRKAILSSAPDQRKDEVDYINGDCLVAVLDIKGCLYICRTSDRFWTKQYDDKFRYEDVVFHERSIYVIASSRTEYQYMILTFSPDLNFEVKRFSLPISLSICHHGWYDRSLVELCGKVVLVFGVVCGENRSFGYRVWELESRDDGNGTYVESFGDGVLLLDSYSCTYLPIKDLNDKNLQGNCIYRTCLCSEFCYKNVYSWNRTDHSFKFEEGGFRNNPFEGTAHRDMNCYPEQRFWFTPNLHI